MSTVGGVMYLDLLKLPPQAKKVGSWVIQDSELLSETFSVAGHLYKWDHSFPYL